MSHIISFVGRIPITSIKHPHPHAFLNTHTADCTKLKQSQQRKRKQTSLQISLTSFLDQMASAWRSEAPRIVQIETRYVETDAINFRAVVQGLTGKNSCTAWVGAGSSFATASDIKGGIAHDGTVAAKPKEGATSDGRTNSLTASKFLKNMSFKDFDRLMSELPSMEELLWL